MIKIKKIHTILLVNSLAAYCYTLRTDLLYAQQANSGDAITKTLSDDDEMLPQLSEREFMSAPHQQAVTTQVVLTKAQLNALYEDLYEAAAEGDLRGIQLLIAQGIDINQPDKDGLTALDHVHQKWATDSDFVLRLREIGAKTAAELLN